MKPATHLRTFLLPLLLTVIASAPCVGRAQGSPDPATVHAVTVPGGAVVSCDGEVKGAAPVTVSGLPPGLHLFEATKPDYRRSRRTVELAAGQQMPLELKLEPVYGLVLVHSSPAEANVQIDGADRGTTPFFIDDLPPGRYRARFSLTGYLPKELEINIEDRTPVLLKAELVSNAAELEIRSTPPGAAVSVNGIDRGVTPCTLSRLPAGTDSLKLSMDGFEAHLREVRLTPGARESLDIALTPIPSALTVVTVPPGARVYINNQFRGEAPLTLDELAPGRYRVRAELSGHAPLARDVTLEQVLDLPFFLFFGFFHLAQQAHVLDGDGGLVGQDAQHLLVVIAKVAQRGFVVNAQ